MKEDTQNRVHALRQRIAAGRVRAEQQFSALAAAPGVERDNPLLSEDNQDLRAIVESLSRRHMVEASPQPQMSQSGLLTPSHTGMVSIVSRGKS